MPTTNRFDDSFGSVFRFRQQEHIPLLWPISVATLLLLVGAASCEPPASSEKLEFFEQKVRPLLVRHCYNCHSREAKKLRGDLRLDTRESTLRGGATGPAVVPGDVEKSLLIQAIRHTGDVPQMPPKDKLSATQIADLEAWVRMGAPDPRGETVAEKPGRTRMDLEAARSFWAFRPVKDPAPPRVRYEQWPLGPIDRFILARLEARGLRPAEPATRRELIRRATFDLTGLPPSPEEIDAFLKDQSPEAFSRVVDRLLASSAYGERWGRHWLDVVRYADTAGDNSDYPIPQMYRYRNWVIDAFNHDVPYDEFIRAQLAGDLLPAADNAERIANLIATGYLANSKRFGSYEDARYPWYLTYEDTIDNLGRTFLGLTINCCRCHDHKFDPLSQADYYALYGFFSSTRYPWPGIELDKAQRDLVPLVSADRMAEFERDRQRAFAEFDGRINRLLGEKTSLEKDLAEAEKLADGSEKKARMDTLNRKIESYKGKIKGARKEKEAFGKQPLPFDTAYSVVEGVTKGNKKVGDACIQVKGDPERPGPTVPRRFPTVLGGQTLSPAAKGSGRLELANWVADSANPLTARVMVNRIWHYHFGKGIVQTPSNFGSLGLAPTHPELLDWLAFRFVESGWSVKAMHRLIMLSRTYQLSSKDDLRNARADVSNDLHWRYDRQRLDAESIRDSLLAVAGNLDRTQGQEHPFPAASTWDFTQHKPFKAVYDTDRRSVYLMTQRIQRHPFLALFDGADTNASTASRVTSTTPLQALFLMNDPFVHAQSAALAERLIRERTSDSGQVERAFLLLFGRQPTAEEEATARSYLSQVRKQLLTEKMPPARLESRAVASLARALFLCNEFVYVD